MDAGDQEGYVLTKPFVLPEGSLYLNADATHGQIQVEVTDAAGESLPGFSRSEIIGGNNASIAVRWNDATLANIADQVVRLRFRARNAKLYSYWVE